MTSASIPARAPRARLLPTAAARIAGAVPAGVVLCLGALALLGAALGAAALARLVWPVDDALTNASGGIAGHDFIAFYAAGRLAGQGEPAATYALRRMIDSYFSILTVHPYWTPWAYPPHVLLAVMPLGRLSPAAALGVWYAVIAAGAVAAVRLVAGSWRLGALGLVALPTVVNVAFGQNGTISAALFAAIVTSWSRAPALAGIALGALAYKPHFLIVPVLLALHQRSWRVLGAAAATVAACAGAALLAWGPEPWTAWLGAVAGQMQYITDGRLPAYRLATIYVLLGRAGLSPLPALALHGAVAAAALAAALWTWRRTGDLFARALTLVLAALLVPPYAYDYDAGILLVPIAALAAGGRNAPVLGDRGLRWLAVLSIAPMLVLLVAASARISPMGPLLALLLAAALRALRRGTLPAGPAAATG